MSEKRRINSAKASAMGLKLKGSAIVVSRIANGEKSCVSRLYRHLRSYIRFVKRFT